MQATAAIPCSGVRGRPRGSGVVVTGVGAGGETGGGESCSIFFANARRRRGRVLLFVLCPPPSDALCVTRDENVATGTRERKNMQGHEIVQI